MSAEDRTPNSWTDPGTGATLHFNDEGKFVDADGNGPQKGFKNDNSFSDWLHNYVQQCMRDQGMKIAHVPEPNGAPIYYTPGAFNNPEKLLVLICGAGRIHAGLWSVGVCAYHGLNNGSVLPCLEDAKKRNMEVVVLNPNYSYAMESHSVQAFEQHIIPGNPKDVYIICHSMGGACTCAVLNKNPEWAIDHIRAVAMTDACESHVYHPGLRLQAWYHDHCINWVCSKEHPDKLLSNSPSVHRSAGTTDHPLSTGKAYPFIWPFFDQMGAAGKEIPHVDYHGVEEKPRAWFV